MVHVKSLGYAEKTIELQTGGDNTIILEEQVNQLSDVVVSAEKRAVPAKNSVSVTSLSAKK